MKKTKLTAILAFLFVYGFSQTTWTTRTSNLSNYENGYLGAKNNRSLKFVTNDTTRIGIDSLGKFNIKDLSFTASYDGEINFVVVDHNGFLAKGVNGEGTSIPCGKGRQPWTIGGNYSLPLGNGNVIGTCDNSDFILEANSNKSLFIKPNGYIGMGINNSSPGAALDIFDANQNDPAYPSHMKFYANTFGAVETGADMNLFYSASGSGLGNFYISEGTVASANPAHFSIVNGKIGIGTTSPSSKLTIDASGSDGILNKVNSATSKAINIYNTNTSQTGFLVYGDGTTYVGNIGTSTPSAKLTVDAGNTDGFLNKINNSSGKAISVYNTATSKTNFVVYGDGTTYIGEKRPNALGVAGSAKLTVDGTFLATEVYIAATNNTNFWADYVFSKDYKLMPLKEVIEFTNKEKHLPGIPSQKELQQSGLNMGEMQKKQMEKIEELYLYVMQLQEQVELLKEENKRLSSKTH